MVINLLSKLGLFRKKNPVFYSAINGEITLGSSYRNKTLYVQKIPQSGGEFVFMWSKVMKELHHTDFKPQSCLVLGIGGGTVLKIIKNIYPGCGITAVDIDPVIVRIARTYFQVPENTKIIIEDAVSFVRHHKVRYDLIIVDLYIADLNPAGSRSNPFLKRLNALKKQRGIILYNCHFNENNPDEFSAFTNECKKIYGNCRVVFSYPKNRILSLNGTLRR